MADAPGKYTINHFSQANPEGPGQENVPNLLRRVAETLEAAGSITVQDLVLHSEITEDAEDRPSLTVYYYPTDESDA